LGGPGLGGVARLHQFHKARPLTIPKPCVAIDALSLLLFPASHIAPRARGLKRGKRFIEQKHVRPHGERGTGPRRPRGDSRPARSSVDFPEPDGPVMTAAWKNGGMPHSAALLWP